MKIIQLLPAEGWYAEYIDPNKKSIYDKLVCFGLIEWTDVEFKMFVKKDVYVDNIEGFSSCEGNITLCKHASNFKGYVYSIDEDLELRNN